MAWLHWFADAGDGSGSPNSKQRSMFGAGLPHATAVPAKASRLRRAVVKYGAIAAVVCILYTFAPGAAVVARSPSDTTTALPAAAAAAAAAVAAVPSSASSQAAASSWLSHGTAMLRQHFGIGGSQGRELAANATQTCGQQLMVKFGCTEVACEDKKQGYINYLYFYDCTLGHSKPVAFIIMLLFLLYCLFLLGDTADEYFCPALQSTVTILKLSPNIAGVTFLSFGNGAPDVFSSLAAFTSGTPKIGIGALVGAGIVVTMGVAGAVALTSAARINRRPFMRDAGFYVIAVLYLLWMLLDGHVHILEALGFLAIYFTFCTIVIVGRILYQRKKRGDVARREAAKRQAKREAQAGTFYGAHTVASSGGAGAGAGGTSTGVGSNGNDGSGFEIRHKRSRSAGGWERVRRGPQARGGARIGLHSFDHAHPHVAFRRKHWAMRYMTHLADYVDDMELQEGDEESFRGAPLLKELQENRGAAIATMTLEGDEEAERGTFLAEYWAELKEMRWYGKVFALFNFPMTLVRRLTVPLIDEDTWDYHMSSLCPFFGVLLFINVAFDVTSPIIGPVPWWALGVYIGTVFSMWSFFKAPRDQPPSSWVIVVWLLFAFIMAVSWIIILANEVVGLLESFGLLLGISNTILGLTVLAWGNSLGDLVADVTVAKEGLPAMAIAGCFAGPMFNMLMGIGLSGTIACARVGTISLGKDTSTITLSIFTLLISLVSSMTVVPLCKWTFTRYYGLTLIAVYFAFLTLSILVTLNVLKVDWVL